MCGSEARATRSLMRWRLSCSLKNWSLVMMLSPGVVWLLEISGGQGAEPPVCSDFGEVDVAADGLGPQLDVVGARLGLAGALEVGTDVAAHGGEVGPHGGAC